MPIRNTHRIGDHLMMDGESGIVHYASKMVRRWDGIMVHVTNNEPRHPQEFVRALRDPKALTNVWPDGAYPRGCSIVYSGMNIGEYTVDADATANTTIPTPEGAAFHVFDLGIAATAANAYDEIAGMEIGCTFIVR